VATQLSTTASMPNSLAMAGSARFTEEPMNGVIRELNVAIRSAEFLLTLSFMATFTHVPGDIRGHRNEAPRSKLRGIKTELRRSQPDFTLAGFDEVSPAIHHYSKPQGILAKANKKLTRIAYFILMRFQPTSMTDKDYRKIFFNKKNELSRIISDPIPYSLTTDSAVFHICPG